MANPSPNTPHLSRHLYAVILAGGSGTRFWPLSRQLYPKQLLRIIGSETLIQQTMRRVLRCVPKDHVLVSTTPQHADSIRFQLGEWKDALRDNFVVEPEPRNTAPAIALAASELLLRDPEAVMLVLPADHVVKGAARFKRAVSLGLNLAEKRYLVTFGVRPIRPETGYGYMQADQRARIAVAHGLAGYLVRRFVEKPDAATAARYVRSGRYFWNSGIFMWRADVVLEELNRHQPALAKTIRGRPVAAASPAGTAQAAQFARAYRRLPALSIDHGVMEHSADTAVIPVDFLWSDVGNWSSLEEVAPRDRAGNVSTGNVVDIGSVNSILYADRRLVATMGLKDMIVVDTPDATLVCPKLLAQDVRKVVNELKRRGTSEHLEHRTVFRPWGSYTVLEEGPGYKVKRVTVNPGGRLSLQLHHRRSEHWVVISGCARVTCGDRVYELTKGHSTEVPKETPHRLENPGAEPLHIIEVQNGLYLGEDDIVRLQDDYGREVRRKK